MIEKIISDKPDINSLYAMTEQIVQNYLIEKPQSIRWISYLFRGLNKRYMLTAEENMNFKDFYVQQHEFIWNKLLMGNCLKKYKKIMEKHMVNNQNLKWAYDVYYSVVTLKLLSCLQILINLIQVSSFYDFQFIFYIIRLFEEFVYEKFGKQTQLQKEDDRRRKIMIVQSYGGTMIPSEGLNCRSISIELLIEIQNLLPKFDDYYTSSQIIGLPYIPDQRIIECSFILLQLINKIFFYFFHSNPILSQLRKNQFWCCSILDKIKLKSLNLECLYIYQIKLNSKILKFSYIIFIYFPKFLDFNLDLFNTKILKFGI